MNSRNRVGPYRVRRGYRGLGPGSGRVYEAVHRDTGNPALLVASGPEAAPTADWQVRVTSSSSPPHLALEVERAGGDVAELTLALHRLAASTSRLEGRPEVAVHLSGNAVARRPRRPHRVRAPLWLLLWAPCLAVVLAWWGLRPTLERAPQSSLEKPLAPAEILTDGVAEVAAVQAPVAVMDASRLRGPARPMPDKPYPGQKRPPCRKVLEVEALGACWSPHKVRPGPDGKCPDELHELGEDCLQPVYLAKEPSSILP